LALGQDNSEAITRDWSMVKARLSTLDGTEGPDRRLGALLGAGHAIGCNRLIVLDRCPFRLSRAGCWTLPAARNKSRPRCLAKVSRSLTEFPRRTDGLDRLPACPSWETLPIGVGDMSVEGMSSSARRRQVESVTSASVGIELAGIGLGRHRLSRHRLVDIAQSTSA